MYLDHQGLRASWAAVQEVTILHIPYDLLFIHVMVMYFKRPTALRPLVPQLRRDAGPTIEVWCLGAEASGIHFSASSGPPGP